MAKRKYTSKKNQKKNPSGGSRIVKFLSLLIILIIVLAYLSYHGWNSKQKESLAAISTIVNTSMGPIEYASRGQGSIILISHMEGSGADNIILFDELIDAGYQIICPSRPGYLNTPINDNATYKYQSEQFAELLDYLNIDQKVIVLGISAGGPAAIEFTNKYPDKTSALILINSPTNKLDSTSHLNTLIKLKEIPLLSDKSDIASWIIFNLAQYYSKDIYASIIDKSTNSTIDTKSKKINLLINHPKAKKDLLNFLECTSPRSKRHNGLVNDLQNLLSYEASPLRNRIQKLVIHSKINEIINFSHAENFQKENANTEVFVYDGNGHAFWLDENFNQINSKIISFLNNEKNINPEQSPDPKNNLYKVTWVNNSDGALLQLKENGTFSLDFPSVDEKKYYEGTFSIVDNQISFTYTSSMETCAGISGIYKFKISNDQMELKSLNDKCSARKQHFSQGWFKID
jgi:pimeloyl-ACP methyl ester carboxylesterase